MQLTLPITIVIRLCILLVAYGFHSTQNVSAMNADGCYEEGTVWDDLGTWDDIEKALDGDPIYETGFLNKDSDPVSSN